VTRKIDGEYTLTVSQLGAQQQSRGIFGYLTSFGASLLVQGAVNQSLGSQSAPKRGTFGSWARISLLCGGVPIQKRSETLIAEGDIVASLQEEILKLSYTRDSISEREWDRKALELEIEVHDIVLLSENGSTGKDHPVIKEGRECRDLGTE
jgi:hypothetical protein